jgi:hypothetical protein
MLVTGPSGTFLNGSIPELVGTNESPLVVGTFPGTLASILNTPGVAVVALTDPPGEPVDPSFPVQRLPNGSVLSDLVVSTAATNLVLPFSLFLTSDSDPLMLQLGTAPVLPANTVFLQETGQVQDVTQFLPNLASFGITSVQVSSDVIPEPSTAALLSVGILGIGVIRLCRRGA